jgi:hypothetical protein
VTADDGAAYRLVDSVDAREAPVGIHSRPTSGALLRGYREVELPTDWPAVSSGATSERGSVPTA